MAKKKPKPKAKAKPAPKRKPKAAKAKTPAEPAKLGRPTLYCTEIAEAICALLMEGKTLRQIEEEPGMPSRKTIIEWIAKHESFRNHYVRAREVQALLDEDEIATIADDSSEDFHEVTGEDGKKRLVFNKQHVERSKLRVDTRKWLMSKRQPKRYGDKLDLNHSGDLNITERMQEGRERLRAFREKQQAEAKARLAAAAKPGAPAEKTKP
jgi:hypothetical protein